VASLESHSKSAESKKFENLKFATDGRKAVVSAMEARGLVEKMEDRVIDVGHSDRSKTAIEPFLSDQWFVRMGDVENADKIEGLRSSSGLAQLAMDYVCEKPHANEKERKACGIVHFFPSRYAKTYLDWLGEKRDWCISRQLWWGHRIPVWTKKSWGHFNRSDKTKPLDPGSFTHPTKWTEMGCASRISYGPSIENTGFAETQIQICVPPGPQEHQIVAELEADGFVQDPDVLDTWFSSALWPHSTLGWPEETAELQRYYPGSVLSTAREIITLWVARMVITGLYNLGKVPFHDVYIHAVIQDEQGRPFKKTLGNGFDPVDIIDSYGADALRFTMASLATETQDIRMPMKRVKLADGRELQSSERFELGRNFCNKIWNAARFAFMNLVNEPRASARADMEQHRTVLPDADTAQAKACGSLQLSSLPIEDRWILSRVSAAAVDVQDALAKFQFSRAAGAARDFFWDSLCDWYLELVKLRIRENRQAAEARQVLAFALDQAIRLLHPFVPYITEQLWKLLNELVPKRGIPGVVELDAGPALIAASYPPEKGWSGLTSPQAEAVFTDLQTATRAVRDIRQTQNVPPKQTVDVTIKVPTDRVASLQREAHVIEELANVGKLTIDPNATAGKNAATLMIGDMQVFVHDVIDPAAERQRLEKELANLDKQISSLAGKLQNEGFVSRAPAEVVAQEKQRLVELQAKRATVADSITHLERMNKT
jgi:valyl-tRNA synthetase